MSEENITGSWPDNFYHATEYRTRKKALEEAIASGLEPADSYRATLLEMRYDPENHNADRFAYAWLMMCALSEGGYLFLKKRAACRFMRELESLKLPLYNTLSTEQKALLYEEWRHLGTLYIYTCVNSKSYGSVFGLIPLHRDKRAEKISETILLAAQSYPTRLGLDELCAPLYQAMTEVFDQAVALGQ